MLLPKPLLNIDCFTVVCAFLSEMPAALTRRLQNWKLSFRERVGGKAETGKKNLVTPTLPVFSGSHYLSPKITTAILNGRQPSELTPATIISLKKPIAQSLSMMQVLKLPFPWRKLWCDPWLLQQQKATNALNISSPNSCLQPSEKTNFFIPNSWKPPFNTRLTGTKSLNRVRIFRSSGSEKMIRTIKRKTRR